MSKSKKKPQAKKPAATKYTARKNKRLILSNAARDDIADYIDLCQYEIGGFGYVTINKEGNFYVDEVFLAKQNVTGTTVDFVDAGLSDAIMKAVEAGRNKELMFCWHSHVNMGAFWSGTDETMIAGMNNGMTPYLVSLVQNKSGEHKARVDYYNPGGPLGQHTNQVTFELDLYHESPVDKVPARIKEEFEKQVNVNARTSFGFGYETSMYGGAGWMDEWDDKRKQSHEKPWIEGIDVRLHNRRFIIGERRVKFLLEKIAKTGNQSLTKNEASDLEAINHVRKQQEKAAEKQVEADALFVISGLESEVLTEDDVTTILSTEGFEPVRDKGKVVGYEDIVSGEVMTVDAGMTLAELAIGVEEDLINDKKATKKAGK